MPSKEDSRPTLLILGTPASPLTGSAADRLRQSYSVRVAGMLDTAVAYLGCMTFDLVIIDPTIPVETISAVTDAIPPETPIYSPQNLTTEIFMTEINRRLDRKRT
jgi:hypothetical protein